MIKLLPKQLKESGLSLVEVLICVVILGFILFIIANIPQSIQLIGSSKHESVAKDVVVQEVERLRSLTYDGLPLGNSTIADPKLASLPASSSQVVVSNCPLAVCTNGEQIKMAQVRVTWSEPNNQIKNVEVVTLIAKNGLQ